MSVHIFWLSLHPTRTLLISEPIFDFSYLNLSVNICGTVTLDRFLGTHRWRKHFVRLNELRLLLPSFFILDVYRRCRKRVLFYHQARW